MEIERTDINNNILNCCMKPYNMIYLLGVPIFDITWWQYQYEATEVKDILRLSISEILAPINFIKIKRISLSNTNTG